MQILSRETKFDFLGKRHLLAFISIILTAASIYIWVAGGDAKFGVDFRGGFEYVVRFTNDMSLETIRSELHQAGFGDVLVQNFEGGAREFSIRLKAEEGEAAAQATTKHVREIFGKISNNSFEMLKEDYVGPVIGEQIKRDGITAFVVSIVGILIYVAVQFNWVWGIGAILALLHDSIIAVGATILAGKELSGATLAAVLTITGYSINDTIIIFDRIRENLRERDRGGSAGKKGIAERVKGMNLAEIMNLSINQTLGRTIITSLTVMIVSLSLWLIGNSSISELAFTLMVGVVCGTYSTMFIACPVILWLTKEKKGSGKKS